MNRKFKIASQKKRKNTEQSRVKEKRIEAIDAICNGNERSAQYVNFANQCKKRRRQKLVEQNGI